MNFSLKYSVDGQVISTHESNDDIILDVIKKDYGEKISTPHVSFLKLSKQ